MANISLFSPLQGDYASRSAELARQQKLAQMLEQMSQQEIPVSTAGGITAPVSPYSALAKALTSFGGAYLSGKSAADEAEMKRAARAEALAARNALYETPPETKTMAGGTYTLKGPESDYTPNVNSEFPEPIARQPPPIPKLEMGDINYNLPAMPRSYEDQRRMLDEYELSDNPLIAQMAASQRSRIEAERDRAAPKFAAVGTGGQVDINPNSPTFEKKIGAPEPKPADLPSSVDEYNFAQTPSGGNFKGSYTDWLKTKAGATHISIGSQTAKLSPEDLDFMARQALSGDTSVFAGLGYGQTGAANRVALRSAMTKIAKDQGISGPDIAAINAQYFGTKAGERTLGTRSANIDMAVSEANQLVPLALDASSKVNRTNYPSLNTVLIAAAKGTGDPNVVKLGVATNSLINTYARAINPSGVPTVSDKEHARELLENAWSNGQYSAAVSQLKLEMDAAAQSPDIVRERLRNAIPGVTNKKPPEYVRNPQTGKLELKAQ